MDASDQTGYSAWRQVETALIDLSVLDVVAVGLDDAEAVLAQAEVTNGSSFVALTP